MNQRNVYFSVDREPGHVGYWLFIADAIPGGGCRVVEPLKFSREVVEGGDMGEPTARFSKKELECLITELWNCGIRPHGWERNDGELGATKYHLEDMRKLVFSPKA